VMERAALLCAGGPIRAAHLGLLHSPLGMEPPKPPPAPPSSRPQAPAQIANEPTPPTSDLRADLATIERARIVAALERCNGNQTLAAQELGISRRTLVNRLNSYDLPRPRRDAKR